MKLNPCACGTDLEPGIGETETGSWMVYCRLGNCDRNAVRKYYEKAIEAWNLENPVTATTDQRKAKP